MVPKPFRMAQMRPAARARLDGLPGTRPPCGGRSPPPPPRSVSDFRAIRTSDPKGTQDNPNGWRPIRRQSRKPQSSGPIFARSVRETAKEQSGNEVETATREHTGVPYGTQQNTNIGGVWKLPVAVSERRPFEEQARGGDYIGCGCILFTVPPAPVLIRLSGGPTPAPATNPPQPTAPIYRCTHHRPSHLPACRAMFRRPHCIRHASSLVPPTMGRTVVRICFFRFTVLFSLGRTFS